jgi:heme exporter protein D
MDPRETTGERLLAELLGGRNSNQSTITINAGGIGVWVATTACLIMLGIVIVGSLWTSREFTKNDQDLKEVREELKTAQAYISAIYVAAPQLKPKDEKKEE